MYKGTLVYGTICDGVANFDEIPTCLTIEEKGSIKHTLVNGVKRGFASVSPPFFVVNIVISYIVHGLNVCSYTYGKRGKARDNGWWPGKMGERVKLKL